MLILPGGKTCKPAAGGLAFNETVKKILSVALIRPILWWLYWVNTLLIDFILSVVAGLEPDVYCTCGHCTKMPSLEESICCQSMKLNLQEQGEFNTPTMFYFQ